MKKIFLLILGSVVSLTSYVNAAQDEADQPQCQVCSCSDSEPKNEANDGDESETQTNCKECK
jgi:hypothetical protein